MGNGKESDKEREEQRKRKVSKEKTQIHFMSLKYTYLDLFCNVHYQSKNF